MENRSTFSHKRDLETYIYLFVHSSHDLYFTFVRFIKNFGWNLCGGMKNSTLFSSALNNTFTFEEYISVFEWTKQKIKVFIVCFLSTILLHIGDHGFVNCCYKIKNKKVKKKIF